MIFLLMKIISPDSYKDLVQLCFDTLHKLKGKGNGSGVNGPKDHAYSDPQTRLNSLNVSASKVSFDKPISSLNAEEDAEDDDA